jgi:hypothetical protein
MQSIMLVIQMSFSASLTALNSKICELLRNNQGKWTDAFFFRKEPF